MPETCSLKNGAPKNGLPKNYAPKRYLFVLNPAAGRGKAARRWPELEALLKTRRVEFEVVTSEPRSLDALLEHICSLPENVAVVAVGGDGTTRSLLSALVGTERPLGVVPLGRGNDLTAALGWGQGLGDAVTRLGQPPTPLDVLHVRFSGTEHFCLNGLGMGFDAQVTAHAARSPKVLGGFGGYALGVLSALRDFRACPLELTLDGTPFFAGESFLCAVMNSTRYGGGFRISPLGNPADALADVLVGRRVSRAALTPLMLKLLRGRHLGHPKVAYAQAAQVSLRWAEPVPLHLDGDLFAPTGALEVTLLPRAVNLLGASRQVPQ